MPLDDKKLKELARAAKAGDMVAKSQLTNNCLPSLTKYINNRIAEGVPLQNFNTQRMAERAIDEAITRLDPNNGKGPFLSFLEEIARDLTKAEIVQAAADGRLGEEFLKPLTGYIKGKTISLNVNSPINIPPLNIQTLSPGNILNIGQRSLHRAAKKFNPEGKDSFYKFAKNTADRQIENTLAIKTQNGNRDSARELWLLVDPILKKNIKRRLGTRGSDSLAEEIAGQVWEKWRTTSPESQYSRDMEQDFLDYLLNRARTLIGHYFAENPDTFPAGDDENQENLFNDISEEEEAALPRTLGQTIVVDTITGWELFCLTIQCPHNKPHQLLMFWFLVMLELKPAEIVEELSDMDLRSIAARFWREISLRHPPRFAADGFAQFESQLSALVESIYSQREYETIRDSFQGSRVINIPLNEFYTKPAASISKWCKKINKKGIIIPITPETNWKLLCENIEHIRIKPHKLLVCCFHVFLNWPPQIIANKMSEMTLGEINALFWQEMASCQHPNYAKEAFAKQLSSPVEDIYDENQYYSIRAAYKGKPVGEILLCEFYTKPAASISDWGNKVKDRTRTFYITP